jgi:MoaA/NifB/PqqE/SkfB family radical SAM enzyme
MKLFCKLPFSRISIDDDGNIWPACCPDWVEFPLGNIFIQSWDEIWMGENASKLREASFDGSLRHCKKDWCPNIIDAVSGLDNYHVIPLEKAPNHWIPVPPIHVNLNYDQTCNLKCPSCRPDFINLRGEKLDKVIKLHHYAEQNILPQVDTIALTGVGDPFNSPTFRKFLTEFDSKKYPSIKRIHLHTNGLLFDEKTYLQMKGLHGIELSTDISIDAASARVYSKVRPPGKWEKLMRNLDFIKRLDNLVLLGISMVVQKQNHHELLDFAQLGENLVYKNRPTFVEFKRMRHDPHLTNDLFKELSVDTASKEIKDAFQRHLVALEEKRLIHAKFGLQPEIRHNLQYYFNEPIGFPHLGILKKGQLHASKVLNAVRSRWIH